jgi:hypothetical protein
MSDRRANEPPEVVRMGFLSAIDDIGKHLQWVKIDLEQWLLMLRREAWGTIEARKEKLGAAQSVVARMGFKLKDARRCRLRAHPLADLEHGDGAGAQPACLRQDGRGEPALLAARPLNSHYEGQVTGKTFNFEGKTDILIRVQGKTIFIAECKIWGGKKELLAGIDQLLAYTSWRDTKAAIIIFNRNKDFSFVVRQIRPTMGSQPKFKRFEKQVSETAFRFAFKQRDDEARELTLTVLVFDVPLPALASATPAKG